MSSNKVKIKPEILKWVIRETEFSDVPNQVVQILHSWLDGTEKPTFNKVKDVSKKTHIPFGYFFLDSPPENECNIVEYRTIDSNYIASPSRELIDTVNNMSSIQEWMSEYNHNEGNNSYAYVGRVDVREVSIKETAADIRNELGVRLDWYRDIKSASESFRYLRKHISDIGILVMTNGVVGNNTYRKLNLSEFRAFTIIDKYAPLIFINSCDTENGKVFSIVHELAHIWIGQDSFYNEPYGTFNKVSKAEMFCNAVAAELLVPEESFIECWNRIESKDLEEKVNDLAKFFHCSRYVISRRAYDNKRIKANDYHRIIALLDEQLKTYFEKTKEKRSGGNFYRSLQSKWDHNFIRVLDSSVCSGATNYTDAYRLTDTNGSTYEKLISEIGRL